MSLRSGRRAVVRLSDPPPRIGAPASLVAVGGARAGAFDGLSLCTIARCKNPRAVDQDERLQAKTQADPRPVGSTGDASWAHSNRRSCATNQFDIKRVADRTVWTTATVAPSKSRQAVLAAP
jgi:hypothetical protein